MEFLILGPLEVVADGSPVPLGGVRQRAVLALLLTHPNEVVSTDRLIDELWSGDPPRTAANTLQYYVSQLRKALGADRIVTRAPGYAIRIADGELDLDRFEGLVEQGDAESLQLADRMWRGPALADFAYEPFAQAEIARLEELRLAAIEERIDSELTAGRHSQLVGELGALVLEHPLRERLHAQHMLALYRSGRQAEALEAYRAVREHLVGELGIEPGPALQRLEKEILVQDNALDLPAPRAPEPQVTETTLRSVLVAPRAEAAAGALVALAARLAAGEARREVIVACLTTADELEAASALANARRSWLIERGISARAAAFTSASAGEDIVRLVSDTEADLLLVDVALGEDVLAGDLQVVLAGAPCDVGLLAGGREGLAALPGSERPVVVPFGGADHDWAAIEIAAWFATVCGATLRLVGVTGDRRGKRRDASRLLASASLLVQRATGVSTEPVVVPPGADGLVEAAEDAGLIVAGLSDRWRQDGLGATRLEVASRADPPLLFVRGGLRPGGLAPRGSLTRFTWSLAPRGPLVGPG
jgi:DNA-binding SARP family transcriptional activator